MGAGSIDSIRKPRGRSPAMALAFTAAVFLASCQGADSPADDLRDRDRSPPLAEEPAALPEEPTVLTPDGVGGLRIGMTRDEVVEASGEDAHPDAVGGPEPEQCDQFRPADAPEGLIVMIEEGRLTRITLVEGSELRTLHGYGVGDEAPAIRDALGREAATTPHKYLPEPAEYISVWATDRAAPEPRGIVYETGIDGRVTHVHAGGPSIEYVEGCL